MGHVNKLIQHCDIDMTFNIETRRTFIENEARALLRGHTAGSLLLNQRGTSNGAATVKRTSLDVALVLATKDPENAVVAPAGAPGVLHDPIRNLDV